MCLMMSFQWRVSLGYHVQLAAGSGGGYRAVGPMGEGGLGQLTGALVSVGSALGSSCLGTNEGEVIRTPSLGNAVDEVP